jgi:hypothetical protein
MRRSTQIIRQTFSVALSLLALAVSGLAPLGAEQSAASPRRNSGSRTSWFVRPTEHFDVYYQRQQESRFDEVAREAERAYLHISADLQHSLTEKVPLILVQTNRDLPQNSWQASAIIRASGAPDGVDHVMLSLESFSARMAHELTHQFEFAMIPRACQMARWALEGLADHETGSWVSSERSALHAAVAAEVIPAVADLAAADRLWGHAVFDFVAAAYGAQGIRRYVTAECDRQAGGPETARAAFDVASNEFDRAFVAYVKAQFHDR